MKKIFSLGKAFFIALLFLVSVTTTKAQLGVATASLQNLQLNSINTLTAQGAAASSYSAITIPTWTNAVTGNSTVATGAHSITFAPYSGSTVVVGTWTVTAPYILTLPAIGSATYSAVTYTVTTGTVMVAPLR